MKSRMVLLSALLALAACDSGSGNGGAAGPAPASPAVAAPPASADAEVLALAEATNIAGSGFPWSDRFPGVVKRWTLPVPVKTHGEPRAVPAMDAIEAKLGFVVFDRTSIANADEATIAHGIVFRQGTSYLPADADPKKYCANVAGAPFDGGYPPTFVRAPGEISARLFVNLDNPRCTASAEVVIHELGHALGLGAHFKEFGDEKVAIGPRFWSVLATLYGNPIGTLKASVVVKQPTR